MRFTALDFETANNSRSSACEVGVSVVEDGKVVETKSWLIKPVGPFLPWNIRIHGIRPDHVAQAPTWLELWPELAPFIEGQVLVAHNASFDVSVLRECCVHYGVDLPSFHYFCSLQVARGTWRELASYSLGGLAQIHDIEPMNYHRAGDDAETCARIVLKAARYHLAKDPEELMEATELILGSVSGSGVKGTGKKNPSPRRYNSAYRRVG